MYKRIKRGKKLAALILSILMIFASLFPLNADAYEEAYAGSPSSEEAAYEKEADNAVQVLEIPVADEDGRKASKEFKFPQIKNFTRFSSSTVTDAVYADVYGLEGWKKVDCNFSIGENGEAIIPKAPVMIWTQGDFAEVYEQYGNGMKYTIELKGSEGNIVYTADEIYVYPENGMTYEDGSVDIMGIVKDIKPGTYTVTLKAYGYDEENVETEYSFNDIQQTYFCEPLYGNTVYIPVDATASYMGMGRLDQSFYNRNNQNIRFEIADSEDNVVALSNESIETPQMRDDGSRTYGPFINEDLRFYERRIDGHVFKSSVFEKDKSYRLNMYIGDEKIIYPSYEDTKVVFTDDPVIRYIDIFKGDIEPIVPAGSTFRIMAGMLNINNKDDFSFEMVKVVDGKATEEIIAKSVASSYESIEEERRTFDTVYTMEVQEGKEIKADTAYRMRVKYTGQGTLLNNAEFAEFYADTDQRITSVDTSKAKEGIVLINAVNLTEGKKYGIKLLYLPPTLTSQGSKMPVNNRQISNVEYNTTAVYNDGKLIAEFTTGDIHKIPIPLGNGDYELIVTDAGTPDWELYYKINIHDENNLYKNVQVNGHIAPLESEYFDCSLKFQNIEVNKENLEIQLVDKNDTKIAELDKESLYIDSPENKWQKYKTYYVGGAMKVTGTPMTGEKYHYIIKVDGNEIAQKDIENNTMEFTAEPFAENIYIDEVRFSNLLGNDYYNYGNYVSAAETELNMWIDRIINVPDNQALSIVLYKKSGDQLTPVRTWGSDALTINGDKVKYARAKLENVELPQEEGEYVLALNYKEGDKDIDLVPSEFKITSKPVINYIGRSYGLLPTGSQELSYNMWNFLNIDASGFVNNKTKIISIDEKKETPIGNADIDVYSDNKYDGYLTIMPKTPLSEGCYTAQVAYDVYSLNYSFNPYGWEKLITVTSMPFVDYSYRNFVEADESIEYRIKTENFAADKSYKGYFYYRESDIGPYAYESYTRNADLELTKVVDLGEINEEEELVIPETAFAGMQEGEYYLVIESQDGKTMADANMSIREVGDVPPPAKDPEVKINKDKLYTNSLDVELNISAEGYREIKIAESLEALASAKYQNLTSNKLTYKLPEGDGKKTLYFQFKTADGKETTKEISDYIYLDTVKPVVESFGLRDNQGTELTGENIEIVKNSNVQLFLSGEKNIKAYINISGDNNLSITRQMSFIKEVSGKAEYAIAFSFGDELVNAKKVTFYMEDYAGNISEVKEKAITIQRLAKITGKVSYTGGEIARYQAVLLRMKDGTDYRDIQWAYANADGVYTFDNIAKGDYKLASYAKRGFKDADISFSVNANEDLTKDVTFEDMYTARVNLSISVKDTDGKDVNGGYVNLSNWEIGEYFYKEIAQGKADITGVPTDAAGITYYAYVYANGHYESKEIKIVGGDNAISFIVPAIGTISGKVEKYDNTPVQNMDVYAIGTTGQYVWARTNADGTYTMSVPKVDGVTYRIYTIDYTNSKLASNRVWTEVLPNTADVNFKLYNKPNVYGYVKGDDGAAIKTTIWASNQSSWSWNKADSDGSGSFRFNGVLDAGKYRFGAYGIAGYYSAEKEVEITSEDLVPKDGKTAGEKNIGDIVLQSYKKGIFTGDFNNVRTDVSQTQKGKNITVRINYHNTTDAALENVTIKAALPEGVTLVPNSGSMEKTITKLKANEKGEMTFTANVAGSFKGNRVTIKAKGIYPGNEQSIGYADVDVVSATINAPSELKSGKAFKVYGEATEGSDVSIFARDNSGNEKVLAFTRPSGRWYYADIKDGLAKGEYKLYAKVTKGADTGLSEFADVAVSDEALSIEDIIVISPSGQSLGVNEETGVAAFSVWVNPQLQGKPMDVKVKFNKGDVPGHYEFIGKDYTAEYKSNYMEKKIEGWSGSGIQKLYYVTDDGKRFVIAEITILIDPSGYVYDRFTNERIKGATVTCEVKDGNGSWVKWDAEKYGQVNPQLTDDEGKYGWMVPDGEYRVKVQKDGYEAYVTTSDGNPKLESIVIPPPRMDVNIGLTNIQVPSVDYTIPAMGATAGIDAQVAVIFTKPMDFTLAGAKLEVTDADSNKVTGTISYTDNDKRIVFAPAEPLKDGVTYNVLISGFKDKKDRSGNARGIADYAFSFTASKGINTVYMKNTDISPANGSANVDKTTAVVITFDKEVDSASVTASTVKLETAAGERVIAELSTSGNKVTLTPESALMASTTYKIVVESDVKSKVGEYLEKDITSSFTTKADPVTPNPGGGSTGGSKGGSTTTTTATAAVDAALAKVDEAIGKGSKEILLTVDKEGNAEVSKAAIDKLISRGMNIVLKNNNLKATIDITDMKEELSKATKVKFVLKEKTGDTLAAGYKKLYNTLELKVLVDSKELTASKKVDVRFDLGALPSGLKNNFKAGIYRKTGSTLEYVPGSHLSKKGVASFKADSFGEFVIAEYSKIFDDMGKYGWASEFVEIMAARQITTGTGGNNFSPEKQVTRAEFAAFITNALGIQANGAKNTFTDVPSGKWYTDAIIAADAAGIIKGDGAGKFNPNEPINREQMAVMIMRAYEYMTGITQSGDVKFADMTEVSSYAQRAVLGAKELGIIDGVGGNRFMPKDKSIRAAAAKMIVRLLELTMQ